jgi:hypothetical protein
MPAYDPMSVERQPTRPLTPVQVYVKPCSRWAADRICSAGNIATRRRALDVKSRDGFRPRGPPEQGLGQKEQQEKMKMIVTAALGLTLLAGVGAVPASAEKTVTLTASEYNRLMERKKGRRYVQRQIEYDADTLPVGTSIWWQQMDREQRGGRR